MFGKYNTKEDLRHTQKLSRVLKFLFVNNKFAQLSQIFYFIFYL